MLRRRRLLGALSDGDERRRWQAAKELCELRDSRTVRRVERVLEDPDADDGPRAAAAYVLGFSAEADTADLLAATLADREDSDTVRAYAAEALGHLLQHDTVLAEVRTPIGAGLRDPAVEVRFWCAFASGVLGLQEARPQLEHLAATDDEEVEGWWTVAEEAAWALRLLDGEEDPPLPRSDEA
jgi:HEAT repeat protein